MQADPSEPLPAPSTGNVYAFRLPEPPVAAAHAPARAERLHLWDLPGGALCPVLGACLPLDELRAALDALFGGASAISDHALHVGVVRECLAENPVSTCVDRAIAQRHAAAVARLEGATRAEVRAAWAEALEEGDVAGVLWAAITHPAADDELREQVLAELHMAQHRACDALLREREHGAALAVENRLLKAALDEQLRISAGLRSLLTRARRPAWRWWPPAAKA